MMDDGGNDRDNWKIVGFPMGQKAHYCNYSKQYVGGRIAHFYQNWLNVTSDPWVLETVLGHRI